MRFRLRLFLLLAALVGVLVVGQALLVRSLAERLDAEVRGVAFTVGEEILSSFSYRFEAAADGAAREETVRGEIVVLHGEAAAAPADETAPPAPGRRVVRRELRLPPADGPGVAWVDRETFVVREGAPLPELTVGEEGGLLLRGGDSVRRIRIPGGPITATLERFRGQLLAGSLLVFAAGLAAAALLAHRTTRPLALVAQAARRIGEGERGVELPVVRRDEIGELVAAFNAMSARLEELDRARRDLAESAHLSELGEVARGLAHTLRNPLNALGLAVERLAGERRPEAAQELAERCRQQIRRLDGSLRGFLALASGPAATPAPVDLGGLAREVALEALQDAAGPLRVEVEAAERVTLPAVEAELKAMLQALVVNACEASPAEGRVVVRVHPTAGGARLEIDDDGPGPAPEIAARLFAPHVTTKPHGSGMGLYLAARLAESRYGGRVALAPRPGGGTRATLELAPRREAT